MLAVTKCDLLDDELCEMLREELERSLSSDNEKLKVVFISSVTGKGIDELKDILWAELNSESNKLLDITKDDTLVHRDKDMSRFKQEMLAEGEDNVIFIEDEMDEDEFDIEELDDYEVEDVE